MGGFRRPLRNSIASSSEQTCRPGGIADTMGSESLRERFVRFKYSLKEERSMTSVRTFFWKFIEWSTLPCPGARASGGNVLWLLSNGTVLQYKIIVPGECRILLWCVITTWCMYTCTHVRAAQRPRVLEVSSTCTFTKYENIWHLRASLVGSLQHVLYSMNIWFRSRYQVVRVRSRIRLSTTYYAMTYYVINTLVSKYHED